MKRLIKVIMVITITFVITSCEGKNSNSLPQTTSNAVKTPEIYVPVSDSPTKNKDLTTEISPDAEDMPTSDTVSLSQVDYNGEYNFLISEWKSALNRHINNEYTENDTFDFGFYSGYSNSLKTYFALYDIDSNGTMELLLRKQNGYEDIIAYIFTIKDGAPINLFGYNDNNLPCEVPWSRVGSSRILDNGLIDCYEGDYTIYKIAKDGYSVIKLASAEPYDYPDETRRAEAKWKFYINETEVNYDFYIQYLDKQGYTVNRNNTLASIDWKSIEDAMSSISQTPVIPAHPPIDVYIWQDVYAGFLRENIPENEVDFNTFIDGSDEEVRFSAFSAGGYPVTPFFYLYDIDKDGVPELIYLDAANGEDGDVYTYKNNSISKIGSINFYPFGGLGISLDKTDGLYSDVGYKGNYGEIYLITMNNNILAEQLILKYNNEPAISPQQPGLPYSFNNFDWLDYYELTESNITKVIYGGV